VSSLQRPWRAPAPSQPRWSPTGLPPTRASSTSSSRALHDVEQYANNKVEADHGRLKARLRPMRGLKTAAGMRRISLGLAFIQNVRRGHYELGLEASAEGRLAAAFAELALMI
jgi:hypothetical protein